MGIINEMREYSNIKKLNESVDTKTLEVEARLLNVFSTFTRDLQGIKRMMAGKDFYGYGGCCPSDGRSADDDALPSKDSLRRLAEEKLAVIKKEFDEIFKVEEKKEETKEEEKKEEPKEEEKKEEEKNESMNEAFDPEVFLSSILPDLKKMSKASNPPKNRQTVLSYLDRIATSKPFLGKMNSAQKSKLADRIVGEWRK